MDLPGYGDSITWGPVRYQNDPRQDDDCEFIQWVESTIEELEAVARDNADSETVCADDVLYGIKEVRRLIDDGMVCKAEKKLNRMSSEYL